MEQHLVKPSRKTFVKTFLKNLLFAMVIYIVLWWFMVGFDQYQKESALVLVCSSIFFASIKTYMNLIVLPKISKKQRQEMILCKPYKK